MSASFLDAIGPRRSHPASVCVVREYLVYYFYFIGEVKKFGCRPVLGLSRQEARKDFERDFPLAVVERVG